MNHKLTACIIAALLASIPATNSRSTAAEGVGKCGVERWPVKVLTDTHVKDMNFNATPTTVDQLRAIKVPHGYNGNSPVRYPEEMHAVTIRARLVGWKLEADRDFHIVVADPTSGNTMIVEPPDPTCSTSVVRVKFASTRAAFVKCFGEPDSWVKLPPMIVELTGIPFFDKLHGQTGVAPNGIELHPLYRVKTISGTCPVQ